MTSLIRGFVDYVWGSSSSVPQVQALTAGGDAPQVQALTAGGDMPEERFPIGKLPLPLVKMIIKLSDPRTMSSCAGVCKAWNTFANDDAIWSQYYLQLLSRHYNHLSSYGSFNWFVLNSKLTKKTLVVRFVRQELESIRKAEEFFRNNPNFPSLPSHEYLDTMREEYNTFKKGNKKAKAELDMLYKVSEEGGPKLARASGAAISMSKVGLSSMDAAEAYDRRSNPSVVYSEKVAIVEEYVNQKQFDKALNLISGSDVKTVAGPRAIESIMIGLCNDNQTEKAFKIFEENLKSLHPRAASDFYDKHFSQKAGLPSKADLGLKTED